MDNKFFMPYVSDRERTLEERFQSLLSEYLAYHIDGSDYWRGIKYAIECLGGKINDKGQK